MLNEKKFRDIYTGFLESGLTVRDYCASHQMNEAKFYYWQNKLRGQLPPKNGFVPVVFGDAHSSRPMQVPAPAQDRKAMFLNPAPAEKDIPCEINYPNGVSLKLNGFPDIQVLQSLLLLTCR